MRTASTSSFSISSFEGLLAALSPNAPPWSFIERTVTFITTQSADFPEFAALMCMNFSAPMSEPNPASVTTKSAALSANLSAIIEEFPWAIFANGPPWMNAGSPSRVWTRFGKNASRKSKLIAPAASISSALTGVPSTLCPITISPSLLLKSA